MFKHSFICPHRRREALRGMVASVHPVATQADCGSPGRRQCGGCGGGSGAERWALWTATTPASGAGAFILVRQANASLAAIDGRETAPGAAAPNMFVRNGKADTALSQTGPLASGVPGALAA